MRHISIKWRMTIWFSLLMIVITALMLVFVMLMNRNQVTRPPAAEVVRMVQRNADDVEYDHGAYDFSDVAFFGHGVYTEIFDADGRLVAGSAAPAVTEVLPLTAGPIRTAQGSDGAYYVYDLPLAMNGGALWVRGTISANAKGSVMEVIVPLAWSVLPALVLLSVAGRLAHLQSLLQAYGEGHRCGGQHLRRRGSVRRIGLPRGRSEINRLAGAFDDMFDRLERSFHAEAQFTSDASHELRTPVAVILTECDTLEQGQPTVKDYRAGVEVIHGQARQMSRLITQLLHITRLEQGTQKLEKECADLSELAQSVCTAQAQLAPRGITLTCGAPEPVTLPLDVTLMTRLLNNLISNAFRYGRDGGPYRRHRGTGGRYGGAVRGRRRHRYPAGAAGAHLAAVLSGGSRPLRQRGHGTGPVHGAADRPPPRRHGGGIQHPRHRQHLHRTPAHGVKHE